MRNASASYRNDDTESPTRQVLRSGLRQEMAGLRLELTGEMAGLRLECTTGFAQFRQELSAQRVELLRWSFLFWIGQVAATAGLISLSLHFAK